MLHKPLAPIEDDTEDAPWMSMSQWSAATAFYHALRWEMQSRSEPILVAAMLPVRFWPPGGERVETLAPDVLVARVPSYQRTSYDVEREGVPPAFVLEVVSEYSVRRDTEEKLDRYERMGIEEYVLYSSTLPDGRRLLQPALQGYRRDPVSGAFRRWEVDKQGRLWSEVLGLWLVDRAGELHAQRPDGSFVLTPDETEQQRQQEAWARRQAESARRQAEADREREARARREAETERDREALARQQLEAELARLRAELERRRRERPGQ